MGSPGCASTIPDKKVNTLSTRLFDWFEEQVARVERERPEGLVIYSGKPDGFVAGADLEELLALVGSGGRPSPCSRAATS